MEISRASFIMDMVALALLVLVPLVILSVVSIRYGRHVARHRLLQIVASIALGLAIILFELDIRLNGWRHLAEASPYFETLVFPTLIVHLIFAIPTLFVWGFTLVQAMRFGNHQGLGSYASKKHRLYGRLSALGLIMTSVTGWIFYWLAFIA